MSEKKSNLTRRDFIKLTAVSAAATATWYSTTLKTDALAAPGGGGFPDDPIIPYMYHGEDPP